MRQGFNRELLNLRMERERPDPHFGAHLKQTLIKYWPG